MVPLARFALVDFLVLVLCAAAAHALPDLCYRLRWRLADPIPPSRIIRPVTG